MKEQIYNYIVHMYGDDDSIMLNQLQGERLIYALMFINPENQKFVLINGEPVNISSIRRVEKQKSMDYIVNEDGYKMIEEKRELTEEEQEARNKLNQLKGGKSNQNLLE